MPTNIVVCVKHVPDTAVERALRPGNIAHVNLEGSGAAGMTEVGRRNALAGKCPHALLVHEPAVGGANLFGSEARSAQWANGGCGAPYVPGEG